MRKLALSILIIGLFCGNVFPFKLGLEFQAGQQMLFGANMRFSDLFELKPQLGFISRMNLIWLSMEIFISRTWVNYSSMSVPESISPLAMKPDLGLMVTMVSVMISTML